MRWWYHSVLCLSFVFSAGATAVFPQPSDFKEAACVSSLLQQTVGSPSAPNPLAAFFDKYFLPVAGKRLYFKRSGQPRSITIEGQSVRFSEFSLDGEAGKDLVVEWVDEAEGPSIILDASEKRLVIPRIRIIKKGLSASEEIEKKPFLFEELPAQGRYLVQQFLIGHQTHPYLTNKSVQYERVALGEPRFIYKMVQEETIQVGVELVNKAFVDPKLDNRRFLAVAPTGLGKTKILEAILSRKIALSHQDTHKLHILTADRVSLINQLYDDFEPLKQELDFEIVRWGGQHKKEDIETVLKLIQKSDKPVVLVTTIHSLKATLGDLVDPRNPIMQATREHLATFAYDEAHHTGAEEAQFLIEALILHPQSKAFLYGTTATPIHTNAAIQTLFGNRAYWVYLDTPFLFEQNGGEFSRNASDIINQLGEAIDRGELSPLAPPYFIDPEEFEIKTGSKLFAQVEGKRKNVLNPGAYLPLTELLREQIEAHSQGFFAMNDIEEAIEFTKILKKQFPQHTFRVLHSRLPTKEKDEIIKLAKKGEINYLVTVRMIDEGIDIPDFSLYIDLNYRVGVKARLQRLGRILRLAFNKDQVESVCIGDFNLKTLSDDILLIESFLEGRFAGYVDNGSVREPEKLRKIHARAVDYLKALRVKLRRHDLAKEREKQEQQRLKETAAKIRQTVQATGKVFPETLTVGLRLEFLQWLQSDNPDKLKLMMEELSSDPEIHAIVLNELQRLRIFARTKLTAENNESTVAHRLMDFIVDKKPLSQSEESVLLVDLKAVFAQASYYDRAKFIFGFYPNYDIYQYLFKHKVIEESELMDYLAIFINLSMKEKPIPDEIEKRIQMLVEAHQYDYLFIRLLSASAMSHPFFKVTSTDKTKDLRSSFFGRWKTEPAYVAYLYSAAVYFEKGGFNLPARILDLHYRKDPRYSGDLKPINLPLALFRSLTQFHLMNPEAAPMVLPVLTSAAKADYVSTISQTAHPTITVANKPLPLEEAAAHLDAWWENRRLPPFNFATASAQERNSYLNTHKMETQTVEGVLEDQEHSTYVKHVFDKSSHNIGVLSKVTKQTLQRSGLAKKLREEAQYLRLMLEQYLRYQTTEYSLATSLPKVDDPVPLYSELAKAFQEKGRSFFESSVPVPTDFLDILNMVIHNYPIYKTEVPDPDRLEVPPYLRRRLPTDPDPTMPVRIAPKPRPRELFSPQEITDLKQCVDYKTLEALPSNVLESIDLRIRLKADPKLTMQFLVAYVESSGRRGLPQKEEKHPFYKILREAIETHRKSISFVLSAPANVRELLIKKRRSGQDGDDE